MSHAPPLLGTELSTLRSVSEQTPQQRDRVRQAYIDAAVVDRTGGARTTGVRWWIKFCVYGRNTVPFTRLTAMSSLEEKVAAEQLLMDFAIWLATCRPSGKQISARTVSKYVSQVRAWHLRKFRTHICGDLDYSAIRGLVKGVCRSVVQPAKRERHGVRTQDLAEGIRRFVSSDTAPCAMWRAALTAAFCGLMRGAEFSLQDGASFDRLRHLTRADLKFVRRADGVLCAVLRMRPAKQYPGQTKDVPIIFEEGGSLLDPVHALKRMVELDPVEVRHQASTPLFRLGGAAITVRQVRDMVKLLMRGLGLDQSRFGAHSLRIGGATAALAAGMSAAAIRTAGRWGSDVYLLYCRASRQSAAGVSRLIGSTPFEDIERGMRFHDEELMLIDSELPEFELKEFVSQDLIDDALSDSETEVGDVRR